MTTLPQLNSAPKYETQIPSTGKVVTYRPYLVKEEKVLMIAFETGEQKEALRAIVDTISACVQGEFDVNKLTTFDIEYLFTQIRSKSVGERSTIMLSCSECEEKNEVDVVLSEVTVEVPEKENVIELTPEISVEMRYPPYVTIMDLDLDKSETLIGMDMVSNSIAAILTPEERIDTSEVFKKEVHDFIDQMTNEQFQKVSAYLEDMPSISKEVEYDCSKCGHHNKLELTGISDFLS